MRGISTLAYFAAGAVSGTIGFGIKRPELRQMNFPALLLTSTASNASFQPYPKPQIDVFKAVSPDTLLNKAQIEEIRRIMREGGNISSEK